MASLFTVGVLYVGGETRRRNNNDVVDGEGRHGSKFWMKMRSLVGCMAFRSNPRGSSSHNRNRAGTITRNDNGRNRSSVSRTNNSSETMSPPNLSEELKAYPHLKKFSYLQLKLATRNFKPENFLGQGGFGSVFKGWINPDGLFQARPGMGMPVAVKTLNQEGLQGHKEWLVWDLANLKYAEVSYLGELQHPNLVKLVGYCIEDEQRMLVYEFMPRGSLEHHLFRRSGFLPWSTRIKILLGAAKGLAFLHEEADRPVIFRDFKTSNVLLDGDYNAKLSDFGLARDAPDGDSTHVTTKVVGTQGYAAPEYVMTGHLTSKSDVYSFGVVLLEMLTGQKAVDKTRSQAQQKLVEWMRPLLKNRSSLHNMMDPRLQGQYSVRGAHKTLRLAAICLCKDPRGRPLMSEVVQTLKTVSEFNDTPHSSPSFQVMMHASPSSNQGGGANRYGLIKTGSGSASSSGSNSITSSPINITCGFPTPKHGGGRS